MNELSKEELLKWLDLWSVREIPVQKQAYQQIREMIQNVPWRKLELALERIEKLKTQKKGLIADYKWALSKIPEKPGITEEWIEEKAKELLIKANISIQTAEAHRQQLEILQDFIRSLVEEIK